MQPLSPIITSPTTLADFLGEERINILKEKSWGVYLTITVQNLSTNTILYLKSFIESDESTYQLVAGMEKPLMIRDPQLFRLDPKDWPVEIGLLYG
jgi:hypothetical protein